MLLCHLLPKAGWSEESAHVDQDVKTGKFRSYMYVNGTSKTAGLLVPTTIQPQE